MPVTLLPAVRRGPRYSQRATALVAAALVLLAWAAPTRAEGPGFKISDTLVLHLGAALGGGYDSNVFYQSGDTSGCATNNPNRCDRPIGAAYVSFRPSIDIATNPSQRGGDTPHAFDFRFHAGMPLRFITSDLAVLNSHYSIGGEAGLRLRINPQGVWGFDLFDNFLRTSEVPYYVVSSAFVDAQGTNINTDQNQLGMRLAYRPGGGRLEVALQYTLGVNYLEGSLLIAKSVLTNDVQLRARWNFFPKTAIYVNVSETAHNYLWATNADNAPPNAFPLRAVVGIIGLITPKFSLNANIGYGNSFTQTNTHYPMQMKTDPSYSFAVGLIDLEWRPTSFTLLDLGYRHDFTQALIGTYADIDAAYISLVQGIWRFNGTVRFGWERRAYHGTLVEDGLADGRIDNILALHVQLDFPVRDWFTISLGDDLAKDFANCRFTVANGPSCDYLRNDVWLRLAFAY